MGFLSNLFSHPLAKAINKGDAGAARVAEALERGRQVPTTDSKDVEREELCRRFWLS